MNAIASSSTSSIPFPSSSHDIPFLGVSRPIAQTQLQYDGRGRLMPFVETLSQRRERLAFLRKKEQSRRVSEWIEASSRRRSKRPAYDLSSVDAVKLSGRPESIPEEDEPESSWSTSLSSFTPANLHAHDSAWPALLSGSRSHGRTDSVCSTRSSRSSLESIEEEDEEGLN
ncbi:unnamed protein product [Somion occarium]|uniref:Uncharacterized protein n=1 Tax=Somion occarium TaxID=3059160 RepID=A0ABP1CR62_9APHY